MEKYRISVIDFLKDYGKHETGIKDVDGSMLFLGDAVEDKQGREHLVAYRYGAYVIKQPFTIHYCALHSDAVKKLNKVVSAPGEWLVIGQDDDDLYPKVKHLIQSER
jgi:hypothetical protein